MCKHSYVEAEILMKLIKLREKAKDKRFDAISHVLEEAIADLIFCIEPNKICDIISTCDLKSFLYNQKTIQVDENLHE